MLRRPKYKFLIKLRQNVWNTSKPLSFKKLKWKKVRRILFLNPFKRKNILKTKYFFLDKFRKRLFFSLFLNTKKIFLNTFGPFKKSQISKIIKKSFSKGVSHKSYDLSFNKIGVNNVKYDNILYLMQNLESKLLTTFTRFGIFSNLFVYLHCIKIGLVFVNGRVIKNPFFDLKEGDIISINTDKLKKQVNIKRIYNKNKLKSKHLIFSYKFLKIIFVRNPSFNDVEYLTTFHWDLLLYLLKLKR